MRGGPNRPGERGDARSASSREARLRTIPALRACRVVSGIVALAVVAVALPLRAQAPAAELSPAEVARALAGRDVPALAADAEKAPLLAKHGERMAAHFRTWERKVGDPLAAWARETIAPSGGVVFYPFSGPDFATAHRIWPDASRYVFVAYQKAGRMPALGQQGVGAFSSTLRLFQGGLRNFASLGFFVTTEMNERFGRTGDAVAIGVEGITGILLMFAELEGFDVESLEPIRIARDGGDVEAHPGDRAKRSTWNSVRLRLRRRADGGSVTLDYLRVDLLDQKLAERPHSQRWLEQVAGHPTLLKAASHLLQRPGFSFLRDTLLERAPSVLQDESGLPYDRLAAAFDVRLFGHFDRFHERFQDKASGRALREAYHVPKLARPLPFRLGYDKKHASCLQYAWRRKGG